MLPVLSRRLPGRFAPAWLSASRLLASRRVRLGLLLVAVATGACNSGGGGDSGGGSGATVAYPVDVSSNGRYLVDQNGDPFPILGRTAWFITALSEASYRTFIDDTVAKGFDAIEFHVVNHSPQGENAPFDGRGDLPFLKKLDGNAWTGTLYPHFSEIALEAPDMTTPNEAYWAYVDALLAYAESKGVLCFFFPAYVGFPDTAEGWMNEMVANGPAKMQAYGQWIATRYRDQKNLVWMAGGDRQVYDPAETAVEAALIAGLKSVTTRSKHYSAEWARNSIAKDQPDFAADMTLNGTYTSSVNVNNEGRRAYQYAPVIPAFLLEEPFDEEGADGNGSNLDATQPVRRFQWWGVLSNVGGYVAGNGYVWTFKPGWESHLDTRGAVDMKHLNAFVRSIAWYRLVPSGLGGMRELVTDGVGDMGDTNYIASAATPDGTLLVAYVPPANDVPFTIDMAALSGAAQARWFNPTTAQSTTIGTFPNVGTQTFTTPGDNGSGYDDWVLVIEKQ